MYKSAITIDVEDGLSIIMKDRFNITLAPTDRVEKNVHILLDLFSNHSIQSTFFVLGEIGEAFPALIREISNLGHEIGVHGYFHDQIYKLTPEKFKKDVTKTKSILEEITGKRVLGHRAPAFSINQSTSWALEVLAKTGFEYDSSIMPVNMKSYGWKGFEKNIIKLELPGNLSIIEVPLPIINIFGKYLPTCGGGYLRYFPLTFTQWAFSSIVKNRPVIMYLHPYELDTERYPDYFYDAIRSLNFRKSLPLLFYRLGKGTVKSKLNSIISTFSFTSLNKIIEKMKNDNAIKSLNLNQFTILTSK